MGYSLRRSQNVVYQILPRGDIREYVINVCEKEWDESDFPKYGRDLYEATWELEEVDLERVTLNKQMLASYTFQKDVQPRIAHQKKLHDEGVPIPPLILRGRDLFIFDGYARYCFFSEVGINKCMAYLGRR